MRTVDLIDRKRQGRELSPEEIENLVRGFCDGDIPDYQMSAWLMAVCCRGMTAAEATSLTTAMLNSGEKLDLSSTPWPTADKHSTGGVGDKTTLVVAPLVRACGAAVAKMSGRGLGFTGGTIDKLESIPGFRVDLTAAEFVNQLRRDGIVISGQTRELAPADGKIYALRDVTATVASVPLIASSIMSKKLAVGAGSLVLDVKVGEGAFMGDAESAEELARTMVLIGTAAGIKTSALISPMDEPLGQAVGNALEVAEAVRTLQGQGPADLVELSLMIAGEMLSLAGVAESLESGRVMAQDALTSGRAVGWLEQLVVSQGGDPRVVQSPELMGTAPVLIPVVSDRSGLVTGINAREIAAAAMLVGAGRQRKRETVDRQAGVLLQAKGGTAVEAGQVLAAVHASSVFSGERAAEAVLRGYSIWDGQGQHKTGIGLTPRWIRAAERGS